MEIYDGLHRYELYEVGYAMYAAFNDPKQLKKFLPKQEVKLPTSGPLKPVSRAKTERLHAAKSHGH